MIAKTLLIGYIAFNGAALAVDSAFGGGDAGVYGVRNINGYKTLTGNYQLRVGGPLLPAAQVDNEWSRALQNAHVTVTLFGGTGATEYSLTRIDNNTYELLTYDHSGEADALALADLTVQFSIDTLSTF